MLFSIHIDPRVTAIKPDGWYGWKMDVVEPRATVLKISRVVNKNVFESRERNEWHFWQISKFDWYSLYINIRHTSTFEKQNYHACCCILIYSYFRLLAQNLILGVVARCLRPSALRHSFLCRQFLVGDPGRGVGGGKWTPKSGFGSCGCVKKYHHTLK